jgi:hypothetical protein
MVRIAPALLLLLLLPGCVSLSRQARYTGTMTPTAGCTTPGKATLTVIEGQANFAPNDGALVLPGTVAQDGTLSAAVENKGSDGKPYRMVVQGKVDSDHAEGVFATPRCRYALDLKRV